METNTKFIADCLQELSVRIGERPVGSANNQRAEHFISETFKASGLEVEHQEFACMDWSAGLASLRLNGVSIPAALSPYSLPCSLNAPFQLLETLEALKNSDLKGQVAVLGGELAKEALMPKNFTFWNPEEHQEIIRLLEEKAPAAIVTASFSEERPIPIIEDGDFDIPSVVVAGKYFQMFRTSGVKVLALQAVAKRKPSRGANVIARRLLPGKPRVLVMAHFDTKPGTPGALDNAAGVCVLLLLGRLMQQTPPPVSVELVAMNGEDYFSNPGQVAYLEAYEDSIQELRLAVNCDGAGYRLGKTGISPINCREAFIRHFSQKLDAFPVLKLSDPWYQGDHMIFAPYDLPTLAITSDEIFGIIDEVIHTERDKAELVNGGYLEQVGLFLHEVLMEMG